MENSPKGATFSEHHEFVTNESQRLTPLHTGLPRRSTLPRHLGPTPCTTPTSGRYVFSSQTPQLLHAAEINDRESESEETSQKTDKGGRSEESNPRVDNYVEE